MLLIYRRHPLHDYIPILENSLLLLERGYPRHLGVESPLYAVRADHWSSASVATAKCWLDAICFATVNLSPDYLHQPTKTGSSYILRSRSLIMVLILARPQNCFLPNSSDMRTANKQPRRHQENSHQA